jgi:hypothetical protein
MLLIIRFTANSVIHGHQNDQQKHGNELVSDAETEGCCEAGHSRP